MAHKTLPRPLLSRSAARGTEKDRNIMTTNEEKSNEDEQKPCEQCAGDYVAHMLRAEPEQTLNRYTSADWPARVRSERLAELERKPLRAFEQWDVSTAGDLPADIEHPDADGDVMCSTFTTEFMSGFDIVRVLIPRGADRHRVMGALQKIMQQISLDEMNSHATAPGPDTWSAQAALCIQARVASIPDLPAPEPRHFAPKAEREPCF